MKKIITIALLVVTLLVGGMTMDAKTTKKKPKARTSQTSKKSSSKLAFEFNDGDGYVKVYKKSNGKYITNDKYTSVDVTPINGAYIIEFVIWNAGGGAGYMGILYGDKFYEICDSTWDENWYTGDGSFNPSTMKLKYETISDRYITIDVRDYPTYSAKVYYNILDK